MSNTDYEKVMGLEVHAELSIHMCVQYVWQCLEHFQC